MSELLWLDDHRNPFDTEIDWLVFSPIGRDCNITWVKTFNEFTNWITNNGLPDGICFDHDLGDIEEKTGFDCAKWLVDYCIDNGWLSIPKYNIQSANLVGKTNIKGLLDNYEQNR